jgi:hypothetical protein
MVLVPERVALDPLHHVVGHDPVWRAVASDDPPKYRRAPKSSIVDAVEAAIRELLAQHPR